MDLSPALRCKRVKSLLKVTEAARMRTERHMSPPAGHVDHDLGVQMQQYKYKIDTHTSYTNKALTFLSIGKVSVRPIIVHCST